MIDSEERATRWLDPIDFVRGMETYASSYLAHGFWFILSHLHWLVGYLTLFARHDPDGFEDYVKDSRVRSLTVLLVRRASGRLARKSRSPLLLRLLTDAPIILALAVGRTLGLTRGLLGQWTGAAGRFLDRCTIGNFATVPPLIATLVIVFMTSDTWKVLGNGFGWRFGLLAFVFVALALGVLVPLGVKASFRVRAEDLADCSEGNVRAVLASSGVRIAPTWTPRRARRVFVAVVALNLWIFLTDLVVIALTMALAFVVVGLIMLDAAATGEFRGSASSVDVLVRLPFLHMVITKDLLSLSLSLGAFSAFYFAVVGLSDREARVKFARQATAGVRQGLAALAVYDVAREYEQELTGVGPRGLTSRRSP